jgi:ribosome-associated heat shock protein Hsp15
LNTNRNELKVRIDKWLWAARFFKTRAMATEAVTGGKVHCNGQRVKPSRILQVGDELRIQREVVEMTVSVLGLSDQRRPAKEAVELYQETAASIEAREKQRQDRQLFRSIHDNARPSGRPSKRDRRLIRTFVRKDEE